MTTNQAIWGNGYHTGFKNGVMVTLMLVGVILLIWYAIRSNKEQEQAEVQPSNEVQQPTSPFKYPYQASIYQY